MMAGASSCITYQCSTIFPLATRKISTRVRLETISGYPKTIGIVVPGRAVDPQFL